jgi:hypothetical protein
MKALLPLVLAITLITVDQERFQRIKARLLKMTPPRAMPAL